jgi:Rrf2 family protein
MLTAKEKYGLKAVVYLAGLKRNETANAVDIAAAETIPKKFLDAILGDLRNAGVVFSKRGPGGGYCLARPAAETSLGEVIRALDPRTMTIACASSTVFVPCEDCADLKRCRVRLTMIKVHDAISSILDEIMVADMLDAPRWSVSQLVQRSLSGANAPAARRRSSR